MKIAKIEKCNIADGPGVRVSLYTSGCLFHCSGCHNQDLWSLDAGEDYFYSRHAYEIFRASSHDYISGLSILGGEPFLDRNIDDLARLCLKYKDHFPYKTIWLWTGYDWEHLLEHYKDNHAFETMLHMINVIVDGPFKEELKDPSLKWRGSSNQRIIDVRKTLKEGNIVLYE